MNERITDEETEEVIHQARVRFGLRALRAVLFSIATLYIVVWVNPDLRGPLLTAAIVLPFVLAFAVDLLLERLG